MAIAASWRLWWQTGLLFGARVHKSRRRGLSSLDVGASTCVHMMKMDGVIENRFRVAEKCRGKTPNIGAKRALPLQRALPDLSLSNPGEGNASERGHIITERGERREAGFVLCAAPPSLVQTFSVCAMSAHISRSDLLTE